MGSFITSFVTRCSACNAKPLVWLALCVCLAPMSAMAQQVLPANSTDTTQITTTDTISTEKQRVDYQHVLYEYFQQDFAKVLVLISAADQVHGFSGLAEDDQDRLRLMQGAAQLNVGLNTEAQNLLLGLLSRTTSDYVQANTWYWLAKAGFENMQYSLSERAFEAIEQGELEDEITDLQWQELIYLNAFARMQRNEDWESMYARLEANTIYPAYVKANHATQLFNQQAFEASENAFIEAKQHLLRYQAIRDSWLTSALSFTESALSFEWLSFAWANPLNWFSQDPNISAQGNAEEAALAQQTQEENALFDRLNLGLAYALLQQQDQANALEVINTISEQGGESDQALLTLGWTLAQQNRWQQSLEIWEYLQTRSKGIFGLQASYGIAYAHQQQGEYANAFFALDETKSQIDLSLAALNSFTQEVSQSDFFDQFQSGYTGQDWPIALLDIKRSFLSTRPDFDAKYLLTVREQAQTALLNLQDKQAQLDVLTQMLNTRKDSFAARQQSLSLSDAQMQLDSAQAALAEMKELLQNKPMQANGEISDLALKMASPDERSWVSRLRNAKARHERLLKDDTRRRPVSPKYAERLARIEGILQWEIQDDMIAKRWAHLRLMQQAASSIEATEAAYARLKARQTDSQVFSRQEAQISALQAEVATQQSKANAVYQRATGQLQRHLLDIIQERITQLEAQQVNTRLAMLRLQDLTPEVEQ